MSLSKKLYYWLLLGLVGVAWCFCVTSDWLSGDADDWPVER